MSTAASSVPFVHRQDVVEVPRTKVLLHLDDSEPVGDCINGHVVELPYGEPVEMDTFFANAFLSAKGALHGIVEVHQTRDANGTHFDLEDAKARAVVALQKAYQLSVDFYVRQQMEDRVASGLPALPPQGRPLAIIRKLGISLVKKYGLRPVGWHDDETSDAGTGAAPAPDASGLHQVVQFLREKNIELEQKMELQATDHKQVVADLSGKIDKLLAMFNGDEKTETETQ